MQAPSDPTPEHDQAACQRALANLLDIGTALALECRTPAPDAPLADRARAFERVSASLRRTVLLLQQLAQAADAETRRVQARKQIIRAVEDTIDNRAPPELAETLRLELLERVDSPEFEHDLAHRRPEDVIAEIRRDMALAAVGRRRTPDDIVVLCAQAAAPAGSGLPQWLAAALPQATKNDEANESRCPEDDRPLVGPRLHDPAKPQPS